MTNEDYKPDLHHAETEARSGCAPPPEKPAPSHERGKILHRLQVLQAELERQKEKLRQAQALIKVFRDRYAEIFEFSPICYITLAPTGKIAEINLAGTALLDENRKKLLRRRFSDYIAPEDRDQWHTCFEQVLKHGAKARCGLRCQRGSGASFNGDLECSLVKNGDEAPALHITLIDVTEKMQAEEARRQFETLMLRLTGRERGVLVLALSGITNKDISTRLGISQRTVENHRTHIHHKTGVTSLLKLAQQAARAGFIPAS